VFKDLSKAHGADGADAKPGLQHALEVAWCLGRARGIYKHNIKYKNIKFFM
jgi:hypothetical protein